MGRKRWTTSEQTAWLTSRIPRFLKAKGPASTHFQNTVFIEWKNEWPLPPPTDDEIAKAKGSKKKAKAVNELRMKSVSTRS